ncbi:MAG: hypothetical protein NPIRA06_18370 [Nitrospirales bacterium]|nr:MAG: hypothetical protein NPIRA06_18370 [Nitrospirales bacterium]
MMADWLIIWLMVGRYSDGPGYDEWPDLIIGARCMEMFQEKKGNV